jgi:hypothetical protein
MEKVTGIGGIFFRAKDPKALRHWYQQHLGVTVTPAISVNSSASLDAEKKSALASAGLGEAGLPVAA